MKLKTALELLGDDCLHRRHEGVTLTDEQLKRFARRAREEAFEMAAKHLAVLRRTNFTRDGNAALRVAESGIRALPTEPTQ